MKSLKTLHSISINSKEVLLDNEVLFDLSTIEQTDILAYLYRSIGIAYPKFFKMDSVSKLGFLATELLLQKVKEPFNKDKVALLLTTADGCRAIDEKFESSRNEIPSPALFVYTLPNIVAGEICIRNGFKGEQMVWIAEDMDEKLMAVYTQRLFSKGNTEACIVGFVNAYQDNFRCELHWIAI